ncbi:hypothetical protein [Pseudodesulfovibrio sp.]|uniref:hypothetical protein n=1 Tax=unclassified Pseudodesulfovibrio TaxID=2661612 RepID=UPI003AFFDFCE
MKKLPFINTLYNKNGFIFWVVAIAIAFALFYADKKTSLSKEDIIAIVESKKDIVYIKNNSVEAAYMASFVGAVLALSESKFGFEDILRMTFKDENTHNEQIAALHTKKLSESILFESKYLMENGILKSSKCSISCGGIIGGTFKRIKISTENGLLKELHGDMTFLELKHILDQHGITEIKSTIHPLKDQIDISTEVMDESTKTVYRGYSEAVSIQ